MKKGGGSNLTKAEKGPVKSTQCAKNIILALEEVVVIITNTDINFFL